MLTKKLEKALNEQVQKEGYAAHLYLSMASWAETKGLEGIAGWMYAQHAEEIQHMLKFIKYINERGGHGIVPQINEPQKEFKSIKHLFESALEHERMVTISINNIVGICLDEKDFTTHNWIQWFVYEQLEEESSVQKLIDKINLVGDGSMYQFDRDILAMRSAAHPGSE